MTSYHNPDGSYSEGLVLEGRPAVYVDRSGTVAVANTAQTLAPANASRRGLILQNTSAGALHVGIPTAASSAGGSLRLDPGDYWEAPAHGIPTGAITVLGGTVGQAFIAWEW